MWAETYTSLRGSPYYNSRIKNTSYRYRYVGKKENGEIRRSLIHGPFIPLHGIAREASLEELLSKHLTEHESKQLLAMAISKIVSPLPLSSLKIWYDGTSLSRSLGVEMKSRRIGELLDKIGTSDLTGKLNPDSSLLYDITFVPSYSSVEIVEYGHAKDHPEPEQVNLSLVMEKKRRLPIAFEGIQRKHH